MGTDAAGRLRLRAPGGGALDAVATVEATLAAGSPESPVCRWTSMATPCDGSPRDENDLMANAPTMESELRQLAHELNQPLAAIVMYADLCDALDVVVKQALRATEIVRALDRKWGS